MVDSGRGKKPSPSVPFPAIVGQADLKTALRAITISDELTGLLISGEKGTAKSTAVRGLADLLPTQQAVADCPYGCPPAPPHRQCAECQSRADPPIRERSVPFVTLPLGATRDRVVGTISVTDALDGDPSFDPGLLARANRGFLYVDEVNLLDDHLVDVLLDAAANGVNYVERDGVSVTHPADFTLIGTMNPEEGELRPQLRDRFALKTTVTGSTDLDDRVTIIDRALDSTTNAYDAEIARSREALVTASERLPAITLPEEFKTEIAELCRDAGVDGHRADITIARTARALAALNDRPTVIKQDVRHAAEFALPHRLQSDPFTSAPDPADVIEDHFDDTPDGDTETDANERDADSQPDQTTGEDPAQPSPSSENQTETSISNEPDTPYSTPDDSEPPKPDGENSEPVETDDTAEATPLIPGQASPDPTAATAPEIPAPHSATAGGDGLRLTAAPHRQTDGPRLRTERTTDPDQLDAAATIRATAARGGETIESRDLRSSIKASHQSALVVFAVDASASMHGPLRTAKGVALELLQDAYEQRDQVALVTFAGDDADVVLPPTDSISLAARHLKELPAGNQTPLPAGLRTASEVIQRSNPSVGIVVLVTDGRANASETPTESTRSAAQQLAEQDAHLLVVNANAPEDRTALIDDIVRITDGTQIPLTALSAERVDAMVGHARNTDPDRAH